MPMPRWWTPINSAVFNPLELKRGKRPVLHHVGRVSGTQYRTPLDATPVDGGYLFLVVYGSESDWVRNVLAAGRARLTVDGTELELVAPRVIDADEAKPLLPPETRLPRFPRIDEFLRMDVAG